MLEKIRQISWVQWILMIVCSISLSILVGFNLSNINNLSYFDYLYYLAPWARASKISFSIALDNFSGEATGDTVFLKQRLLALTSIILFFIVGPGLLILNGYESNSSEEKNNQRTGLWGFKASIVITLMGLLPFTLIAIVNPTIHANNRTSASKSEKIDELRQDLILLATDSFEYMVLPERLEGGDGSFEGLQLQELPSYIDTTSKSYSIQETSSDTVLKIIARGKPDYAVEKGGLGEVSVSVEVRSSTITNLVTLKEEPETEKSIMTQLNRPLEIGWETITK